MTYECPYGCVNGACAKTLVCAKAGLRADIYGGPNHICCTGLILQGGVCNVPPSTTCTDSDGGQNFNIKGRNEVTYYDTDKH